MGKTHQRKLEANARYRKRNREDVLYHKRNARLRRFGLEPEDLTRMLEIQEYKCACCGEGPLLREGKTNLSAHIDHFTSEKHIVGGKVSNKISKSQRDAMKVWSSVPELADPHDPTLHGPVRRFTQWELDQINLLVRQGRSEADAIKQIKDGPK